MDLGVSQGVEQMAPTWWTHCYPFLLFIAIRYRDEAEAAMQVHIRGQNLALTVLHARCRANMAHTRESRPDSDLGFQAKVLSLCQVVPSSFGTGLCISFLVPNVSVVKGRDKTSSLSFENYYGWKMCVKPLSVAGSRQAPTSGGEVACRTPEVLSLYVG
jgi:hypothetical protein